MTKEQVQEKFQNDNAWLFRGIIRIYQGQDADEQKQEDVKRNNHRGFKRGHDAKFLCSIAKQILTGNGLSSKQLYVARNKMNKYAYQCLQYGKKHPNEKQNDFIVGQIEKSLIATTRRIAATEAAEARFVRETTLPD
jgi:hypothetical protein